MPRGGSRPQHLWPLQASLACPAATLAAASRHCQGIGWADHVPAVPSGRTCPRTSAHCLSHRRMAAGAAHSCGGLNPDACVAVRVMDQRTPSRLGSRRGSPTYDHLGDAPAVRLVDLHGRTTSGRSSLPATRLPRSLVIWVNE